MCFAKRKNNCVCVALFLLCIFSSTLVQAYWWDLFNVFNKKQDCGVKHVLRALRSEHIDTLKDKKIVIVCNKAPHWNVPFFPLGDALGYLPRLCDYLEKRGAKVFVAPPKPLVKFFKACSDLDVLDNSEDNQGHIIVECSDLLGNIPNFHKFETSKRYLGKSCKWANKKVNEIAKRFKKMGGLPVVFMRRGSRLPAKHKNQYKFGYANRRSMSREEMQELIRIYLQNKSKEQVSKFKRFFKRVIGKYDKNVQFYNIQFERRREKDISGAAKPATLYKKHDERRGAFVNDAILMKAAIKVGGQVVCVDAAITSLALGIPEVDDNKKNIKILLAKNRNSRWKGPFLKKDGSSVWPKNADVIRQEKENDWLAVGYKLMESWERLEKGEEDDK